MLQPTYDRCRSLKPEREFSPPLRKHKSFAKIHSNTTFDELDTADLYITQFDQLCSMFFTAVTSIYRYVLGSQSCLSAAA